MKEEFLFITKTLLIGLGLIVLMQFRVGGTSLEAHAMGFVQSSTVVQPLHAVAHGGVKLAKDTYRLAEEKIRSLLNGNKKEK